MLPQPLRLRRSEDYAATIRRGVRAGRGTVLVHAREVPGDAEARVGFVVAKTVGGAVVRNRIRRRLRGVVIEHRESLPHGADVVVRALPPAATADFTTLRDDLLGALRGAERRLAPGSRS